MLQPLSTIKTPMAPATLRRLNQWARTPPEMKGMSMAPAGATRQERSSTPTFFTYLRGARSVGAPAASSQPNAVMNVDAAHAYARSRVAPPGAARQSTKAQAAPPGALHGAKGSATTRSISAQEIRQAAAAYRATSSPTGVHVGSRHGPTLSTVNKLA
jgi:hypothetical protein